MDRKSDGVALPKRHDFHAALHARPLLGQDKLAAGEIAARLGKQNGHLDRKGKLAVEILMQAIEVSRHILQQQRRRTPLAGFVALPQEGGMLIGIAFGEPLRSFHRFAMPARWG